MGLAIRAIEYHLPEQTITNEQLSGEFPEWSVEKIYRKTGIASRRVAAPGECASDLAYCAAQSLFKSGVCTPTEIDYLLLCTQSPDFVLPTTACLLQERLGLPHSVGALDYNLGCSGFIYGLGLAHGLVETGQANRVLLIMAETYSKLMHPRDRTVRALFGDAASAILLEKVSGSAIVGPCPYVFGTDGVGGSNLIVRNGGMRFPVGAVAANPPGQTLTWDKGDYLFMDGAEIFNFTIQVVPDSIQRLLLRTGKLLDDVDLFVFHQANQYMLEHLRKKLLIPEKKFYTHLGDCGNTVSSTIPIALRHAILDNRLHDGDLVMLVGFGVGYSWGAIMLRWPVLGEQL